MDEIVHIAIVPNNNIDKDFVRKVSAVVNRDLYDTRLTLAGKIPKIIAHDKSMQAAELTAQSLRNLGLVVMVCTDENLRKALHCFRPHTIKLGQQEVLFMDKNGQLIRVALQDAYLLLEGKMPSIFGTEETVTKRKINLPATVLTGGLPIFKQVKEKTEKKAIQTESFLRIYDRKSLEPLADILQNNLDYSILGTDLAASPHMNFRSVVKKIRDVFHKAIYDNRLADPGGNSMPLPLTTPQEAIEINCKLICMFYQAV